MKSAADNRFRNVTLLGEGGMARVYLVVSEGLAGSDKLVVLKLLRPDLAHDSSHRGMFLDEARLAVKLEHPNIVHTTEAGERGGLYYLMMEFLDGQPLSRIRQASSAERLPLTLHLYVLLGLLKGLSYAHDLVDLDGSPLRIVHRDVSPQNVFVTYDGQVKVVDFGIAKAASSRERTEAGIFKGKTGYASPEQVLGDAVDQRSDVFSAGIMLCEAITGRRFWGDRPDMAILLELANQRRVPVPRGEPGLAPELLAICERALKWDRDERFSTARELADALEGYLDTLGRPPTARDLAEWMAPHFRDERSRLRKKIEARATSSALEDDFLAVMAAENSPAITVPVPAGTSTSATANTPILAPRRAGWGRLAFPAFGLAAAAAAVAAFGASKPAPSAATRQAAASARLAAPPTPAPPPGPGEARAAPAAAIELDVRTDPPGALLSVDGVPVGTTRVFPRDGARHRLSVSAAGFEPRSEDVTFDHDSSLSVALRPLPAKTAPPNSNRTSSPPSARPQTRVAAPRLDEESPYRQ
jgi:serine/threonine-protein kinase